VLAGAGILLNVAGGASVSVRARRARPKQRRDSQQRARPTRAA
jgi:hypothetical protein